MGLSQAFRQRDQLLWDAKHRPSYGSEPERALNLIEIINNNFYSYLLLLRITETTTHGNIWFVPM